MPLRVALFVQRYPPALGGSEAYFARLSRYLVHGGDRVTVFTTTGYDLNSFWSPRAEILAPGRSNIDGVEVRRYPLWHRVRGRRWLLKPLSLLPIRRWQSFTMPCNPFAWGMWRDCGQSEERFDVVHATAFPYSFPILCAQRLARRSKIPFLLTPFLHLGDLSDPKDATRRAYTSPALMSLARTANVVFAQTPSERDALVRHGVAAERVILQGLGVDCRECTSGDRRRVRQVWGVADGEVVIGHLANNSAEKGTIDFLKAAALLQGQGVKFRAVLAGPEMPSFRRFWRDHPQTHRIVRMGKLTDEQKRDFFAGIDLFALPSRSDSFGLVLLEAWANGVPNVAYRAGGIADVVQDDRDGILVQCGNVEALADEMRRLIDDRELRFEMGARGQKRVEREFRWEDKLALVRETQERLISGPVRPTLRLCGFARE